MDMTSWTVKTEVLVEEEGITVKEEKEQEELLVEWVHLPASLLAKALASLTNYRDVAAVALVRQQPVLCSQCPSLGSDVVVRL